MASIRGVFTEPLVHFAVIGVLLFVVIKVVLPSIPGIGDRPILNVSAHVQTQLRDRWRVETGRPPTAGEFRALLNEYIDDELLVREAQRVGLQRSDSVVRDRLVKNIRFSNGDSYARPETPAEYQRLLDTAYSLGMVERDLVVRRRLIQRMQHAIQSRVAVSEEDARAWYKKYPSEFMQPSHYRITQLFINRERHGENTAELAQTALSKLRGGITPDQVDIDSFLLNGVFAWATTQDLRNQLGDDFAQAVEGAEVRRWLGPVASIYGLHLIRVESVSPQQVAPYLQVKPQVIAAVYAARDRTAVQTVLRELRQRYSINIESPTLSKVADSKLPAS